MEKSKVLIQFLVIFRQSGDVLFFLYARRLRGYTATAVVQNFRRLFVGKLGGFPKLSPGFFSPQDPLWPSQGLQSCLGDHCEGCFLSLGCSVDQSDEKTTPIRCGDRLRNNSQWFPGSLNYCSWMFPEQLRNKSELVGSEESRQVLTRHPRYVTLFC